MDAKAESQDTRICFDRIVPVSYQPRQGAMQRAIMETALRHFDVENAREVLKDLDPSQPIHVARMAILNLKKWDKGSTLKCRFLDGTSTQKDGVAQKARIWEQYANIKIDFVTSTDEQIRISFKSDPGSWSAIGTDALITEYFPKYQPTMNYGWLKDNTDDTEYERVVVHEFGHALGCIHEHQSPNENLEWNVDAVYQYFSGPPNFWSKEEIDSNVLEKYSANGITATIFDPDSIMLYQFPGFLFKNGAGTPNNTHLSSKDEQLIGQMYPK
jgi:hypothetical protein